MQVQLPLRYVYLLLMFSVISGIIWLSAPTASQAQSNICASVTQISAVECAALVSLYDSTHSTGWTQRASWLLTETPCEWHGVTCRDGHVVTLALSHNNLSGTLPSAVGDLTHLQVLDLAENQLSGKLPPELGSLRQLKWLYLNDNAFSGPLPTSLMNLDNLEKLWFYHTNLCETAHAPLTTWLGSLADVQFSGMVCPGHEVTTVSMNLSQPVTPTLPITIYSDIITEEVSKEDLNTTTIMGEVMKSMTNTNKADNSALVIEIIQAMAKMTPTNEVDSSAIAAQIVQTMAKMTDTQKIDATAIAEQIMNNVNHTVATTMTTTANVSTTTAMTATDTVSSTASLSTTTAMTATDTVSSTATMTVTVMTTDTTAASDLTLTKAGPVTQTATIPQSGGVLTSTNGAGLVLAALAMIGLLVGGTVINRKFYPERFD